MPTHAYRKTSKRGSTVIEYVLMAGLVMVAIIAAVTFVSKDYTAKPPLSTSTAVQQITTP